MSGQGLLVARIVIERFLDAEGGDSVWSASEDGEGEPLPLVMALGMLELTKDTLIRDGMGES